MSKLGLGEAHQMELFDVALYSLTMFYSLNLLSFVKRLSFSDSDLSAAEVASGSLKASSPEKCLH